ncbi:hypothetical protein EON63_06355 [archaeon]|nr:MAG: hypothetical protein EON63_06355 [archaeon]
MHRIVHYALYTIQHTPYTKPGENCTTSTGRQTMEANGYVDYTVGYCIGILLIFIVGCRAIAYLALRFNKA